MRTTTWLMDWASCWTVPGVTPEGGAVELPEDIPLPASSAKRTATPADSRRYRMAHPLFHWVRFAPNHSAPPVYVKKSGDRRGNGAFGCSNYKTKSRNSAARNTPPY